jgi:hypothetical protein
MLHTSHITNGLQFEVIVKPRRLILLGSAIMHRLGLGNLTIAGNNLIAKVFQIGCELNCQLVKG